MNLLSCYLDINHHAQVDKNLYKFKIQGVALEVDNWGFVYSIFYYLGKLFSWGYFDYNQYLKIKFLNKVFCHYSKIAHPEQKAQIEKIIALINSKPFDDKKIIASIKELSNHSNFSYPQIDMQANSLPADTLQSPPFRRFFNSLTTTRSQAIYAAVLLVSLASKGEEKIVLEILEEMKNGVNPFGNFKPLDCAIRYVEKIKQVKFQDSVNLANEVAIEVIDRLKYLNFHGTHSKNLESILKHGLSVKHVGDRPNLDTLNYLGTNVLGENLFGFRYVNCVYERGNKNIKKIFVTTDAGTAAYYAGCSPEWVSFFLGRSYYSRRDREGARMHLEQRLDYWKRGMSPRQTRPLEEAEAREFRKLFEDLWTNYAECKPVVFKAMVPFPMDNSKDILEREMNEVRFCQGVKKVRKALERIISYLSYYDRSLEESIPATHIAPFYIPV